MPIDWSSGQLLTGVMYCILRKATSIHCLSKLKVNKYVCNKNSVSLNANEHINIKMMLQLRNGVVA